MVRLHLRAPRAFLPLVVSALLLAAGNPAGAQARRVDTEVALSHVIKKVDAVVPDEAKAKKIGGPVIADATIDARGAVFSLTILSGHELLRPAAERALRQWVFKPFTVNGKPASVQAILEIDFPDPIREEELRHYEDYRAADYECRRQLELDASKAEAACAAAIRSADLLPPDRVLERSLAVAHHGHALMAGGRAAEAIVEFERVLAMRERTSRGADADSAGLRQTLALLHQQVGETEKADAEFSAAIAEYTAAIEQLPSMRQVYEPRLRVALIRYTQLKRATGDLATAAVLETRAAAISAQPASLLPLAITRSVDGIDINEPVDARLSDEDLRGVLALLAGTGKKPWRLQASASHEEGTSAGAIGEVQAFFAPDVVTPAFRRGAAAMVMRSTASWAKGAARAWAPVKNRLVYVQVASSAAGASDEPPIPVMKEDESPMPGDEELTAIVQLVRARAVPKPTDKYLSDVQPWPIRDIRASSDGVRVTLGDTAHEDHFQWVRLRKASGQWVVAELVEIGRRPTK